VVKCSIKNNCNAYLHFWKRFEPSFPNVLRHQDSYDSESPRKPQHNSNLTATCNEKHGQR